MGFCKVLCVVFLRVRERVDCANSRRHFYSVCKCPSAKAKGATRAAAAAVICINLVESLTCRLAPEILPWKTFECCRYN